MSATVRRGRALGLAIGIALSPRLAQACASCFTGTEGTREAYYGTTALLILVPLALLGAIAFWLHHAARAQRLDGPSAKRRPVNAP